MVGVLANDRGQLRDVPGRRCEAVVRRHNAVDPGGQVCSRPTHRPQLLAPRPPPRLSAYRRGPPHDGPESADRPIVPPEPCELLAEEVEPGAPYVGRCSNVGCAGGCSPHVVVLPMMASIACWDATADRLRRRRDHHRGRRRRRLRPVEDARHPRAVLALIGVATYAVGIIRPLLVKRPRYWHAGETTRLSCIVRNRSFLNERTITALSLVDAPGWLKRTFWPFWKRGAQHPELIVWACPAWRRLASGTKGSLRQSFARATSRVPSTPVPVRVCWPTRARGRAAANG